MPVVKNSCFITPQNRSVKNLVYAIGDANNDESNVKEGPSIITSAFIDIKRDENVK